MDEHTNGDCRFLRRGVRYGAPIVLTGVLLSACNPTVTVAPPSEPITINLNVKIDHEVKIKVDRELDQVLSKDSKLF